MNRTLFIILLAVVLCVGEGAWVYGADYRLYRVDSGKEMPLAQAVPELRKNRVIVVGELHNEKQDHLGQLAVIEALYESGTRVAVGMEMFQAESQKALDRWVEGDMSKSEFQKVYYENWNFPWPLYSMILEFARKEKIPLVGLNIPPEVSRQVALGGFDSLSEKQRKRLPDVVCKVDPEYMAFIKRAYEGHVHGHMDFTNFCEAQLLWNEAMAANAVEYLKDHPQSTMVLLTGIGHARKRGIAAEIKKRSNLPTAVILPQVPGYLEPGSPSAQDGDYLLLGLDEGN